MAELGFGAEGCARALEMTVARVMRNNPLANTPVEGGVPRANVSHAKPVIWVHIHKSMGTFIYSMAMLNHENVVRPSFNGNWWPYDSPDPSRTGEAWQAKADCSKRAEFFAWSNVTWAQIEHDMDDYNLCHGHFNYGILLRDPNALAISKASMEGYSPEETIASLECLVGRESGSDLTHACNSAAPKKNNWRLVVVLRQFPRPDPRRSVSLVAPCRGHYRGACAQGDRAPIEVRRRDVCGRLQEQGVSRDRDRLAPRVLR
mmetsp:Transcript_27878/g.74390  ORF Transcript_27878/g.74390 Transcript_27878/m.74390 type:complete len:260 (+) Transcript_27878:276-1055(+)